MPGALSYLIEKVEGLEKTAQSLLNRQEESSSPHWINVDELCNYIPSHPVKQTVYGWVSDKQIPHHKINKALVFLQSDLLRFISKSLPNKTSRYDAFMYLLENQIELINQYKNGSNAPRHYTILGLSNKWKWDRKTVMSFL